MSENIPARLLKVFRDRHALLWVCQGYDLNPGEKPHKIDLPKEVARLRYRSKLTKTDITLASIYWEAVWLEGARSPILSALRSIADSRGPDRHRAVVTLAGASDSNAKVSSLEFLPVCVLPGLLEEQAPADAQYGASKPRMRDLIAWQLAMRLRDYQGRLLVVIGAQEPEDLRFLFETLEGVEVADMRVLLVLPKGAIAGPPISPNPAVELTVWHGSTEEFADYIAQAGAPSSSELPRWAIRVSNKTVQLTAHEVQHVLGRFALVTERDLLPSSSFTMQDLQDFLEGSLENWSAFGVDLPVNRSYRSEEGRSLEEELKKAIRFIEKKDSESLTTVIQLPCEGGAGATTMLRAAAFSAAGDGYPTLILRPEQVDIDLDQLLAFSTSLSEACSEIGLEEAPPLVIVTDVEHSSLSTVRQIPQILAGHSRKAVLLQAINYSDEQHSGQEKRMKRFARLAPLLSRLSEGEVDECREIFAGLASRWDLPIQVPSQHDWHAYERMGRWHDATGGGEPQTHFWVALRFFLVEGIDLQLRSQFQDASGLWIQVRMGKVIDAGMKRLLQYVACLSSYRVVSPIWSVLRPITGGQFTSALVETLKQTDNIVIWTGPVEELNDQGLRFAHPALADEFLRQEGITSFDEKIEFLGPVLNGLSAGHQGDIWLAETLAWYVLGSERSDRISINWELRLKAFASLPPVIRDQSKTVLHHWARCLYLSADSPIPEAEKQERIESAIEKLKKAIDLPRRASRDEHPSHLYNTLGTAYCRYANLLETKGNEDQRVSEAWDKAWFSFRQALASSVGINIEALLAFAHRLLSHSQGPSVKDPAAKLNDIAEALSLLDDASEVLHEAATPEPQREEEVLSYRSKAFELLREGAGLEFARELQQAGNSDVGYYCEAQILLSSPKADLTAIDEALRCLQEAEERGVRLQSRSLKLRISLLRRHPTERFNFQVLRKCHEALEARPDYQPRPIDLFQHAVLCYQMGDFEEGAQRFRRLRELVRSLGNAPPRIRDFWRTKEKPERFRPTHVKVLRITSEFRAEGYVEELRQKVPLSPRQFSPSPKVNEVVNCIIRFGFFGPLAVPNRFEETTN